MITYPVNVAEDRFTFKLGETVKRRQIWPRDDGNELANADPELVILQEVLDRPTYDSATHRLDNWRWVDDEQEQTATYTADVVALTQTELDAIADDAAREGKRTIIAQAIPTLRQWADDADAVTVTSGNAVSVLQTTVDRMAIFFDRFADLLEYQRIDQ